MSETPSEQDTKRFGVSTTTPVEHNKDLDDSILEVKDMPSDGFGVVKIAVVEPRQNEPYIIIGHPMGQAHMSAAKAAPVHPQQSPLGGSDMNAIHFLGILARRYWRASATGP